MSPGPLMPVFNLQYPLEKSASQLADRQYNGNWLAFVWLFKDFHCRKDIQAKNGLI